MWSSLPTCWGTHVAAQEEQVITAIPKGIEDENARSPPTKTCFWSNREKKQNTSDHHDDDEEEEDSLDFLRDDSEQQYDPAIELAITKSSERYERTRRKTLTWMALCMSVAVILLGVTVAVTSRKKHQQTISSVIVVENTKQQSNAVAIAAFPTFSPVLMPSLSPTMAPLADMVSSVATLPTPNDAPITSSTSRMPSDMPSQTPSRSPIIIVQQKETNVPTARPSVSPTVLPTIVPTENPTIVPSTNPTTFPSVDPTIAPTSRPTGAPVPDPPSLAPLTALPTQDPISPPTGAPSTSIPTLSGLKSSWPELVGMDATKAGWMIVAERPDIETILFVASIDPSAPFVRNRVRIVRDPLDETVVETPFVG